MLDALDLMRNHFYCCLNCGFLQAGPGRLCKQCLELTNRFSQKNVFRVEPFVARSLYSWRPGQSDFLSKLIRSMKGSNSRSVWHWYSGQFARMHPEIVRAKKEILIVPAPPSKTKNKDHAYCWAEGLALAIGAKVVPCLEKPPGSTQKKEGRAQRALVEINRIENCTDLNISSTHVRWVFVDDVLTTGATARAAHKALGEPVNFESWVFAHRSLSCGASKVLL